MTMIAAPLLRLLPPRALAACALAMLALAFVPWLVSPFHVLQVSYGLVFSIAALGFNLLLGYSGLLSFGHAAFFGTGAYAAALLLRFFGVTSMELYLLGGVGASLLIGAIMGAVCVRYTRIFFAILALALSQVLWSLTLKYFWVTGGTDGLRVPAPTLVGGLLVPAADKTAFLAFEYYYYVLTLFAAAVILNWLIVRSPFGKALQASRDNEVRAEFVGLRVRRYRFVAFVISAGFTGLAGALWVPLNGLTSPDVLHWTFSGKIVFMTVLGGFRTFLGPIVGAMSYNYLETFSVGYTTYWQLLLGIILVALVLAMPDGLVGTALKLARRARRVV